MMHLVVPATSIQSHMVSIHSPQSTRNTMRNEWKKSFMCQRGRMQFSEILHTQSLYCFPNSCMPTTAKMKTIMASTSVRLPKAPTELPIILISVLRVGHDLANLNTLIYKRKEKQIISYLSANNCDWTLTLANVRYTHQSEWSQNRHAIHVFHAQLHQAQTDNDWIKNIPFLLEVIVWVHSNDLEDHFCREDASKNLY